MNIYKELNKLIKNAYCPYSKYRVASIVETDKGFFKGVNVENGSYGGTICAERNAINNAICNGSKKFKAIFILSKDKTICGICLQTMGEFFDDDTNIVCYNFNGEIDKYKLNDLLPKTFKLKSNL